MENSPRKSGSEPGTGKGYPHTIYQLPLGFGTGAGKSRAVMIPRTVASKIKGGCFNHQLTLQTWKLSQHMYTHETHRGIQPIVCRGMIRYDGSTMRTQLDTLNSWMFFIFGDPMAGWLHEGLRG